MKLSAERVARSKRLIERIESAAARLGRRVQLMEVCGTHSHAIGRYGLRQAMPEQVELISGPGCPVCVTTAGQIEMALELARRGVVVATFGDMVRVPGGTGSLAQARAEGAEVVVVYSPQQALELAIQRPGVEVAFVAVGFETTAPTVAAVAREALARGVDNFSLLGLHKLIPPALDCLLADPATQIDGLIAPGHVSVIIGADAYRPLVEKYSVPCVVAGFEPEEILLAIALLLEQLADGRAEVENAYAAAVRPEGNRRAQALLAEVFEVADADWRGLGTLPGSGLQLGPQAAALDAARRYGLTEPQVPDPPGCQCGEVLRGIVRPWECPLFGRACTPQAPVGPCMVSSEGACAAAYKYAPAAPAG